LIANTRFASYCRLSGHCYDSTGNYQRDVDGSVSRIYQATYAASLIGFFACLAFSVLLALRTFLDFKRPHLGVIRQVIGLIATFLAFAAVVLFAVGIELLDSGGFWHYSYQGSLLNTYQKPWSGWYLQGVTFLFTLISFLIQHQK